MSSEINLKITKKTGSDVWDMVGEEFRDGELVGASSVVEASNIQLITLLGQILVDHE